MSRFLGFIWFIFFWLIQSCSLIFLQYNFYLLIAFPLNAHPHIKGVHVVSLIFRFFNCPVTALMLQSHLTQVCYIFTLRNITFLILQLRSEAALILLLNCFFTIIFFIKICLVHNFSKLIILINWKYLLLNIVKVNKMAFI